MFLNCLVMAMLAWAEPSAVQAESDGPVLDDRNPRDAPGDTVTPPEVPSVTHEPLVPLQSPEDAPLRPLEPLEQAAIENIDILENLDLLMNMEIAQYLDLLYLEED